MDIITFNVQGHDKISTTKSTIENSSVLTTMYEWNCRNIIHENDNCIFIDILKVA